MGVVGMRGSWMIRWGLTQLHPGLWSLVCQQMGIQVSTPGSVTQSCLVSDSVSSSGSQLTALS